MPTVSHQMLFRIGGCLWLIIGAMLLYLGISFLSQIPPQKAVWLIVLGLIIGNIKGRTVFKRAVKKQVLRIEQLPKKASLKDLYTPGYYLLLAFMMGLGFALKYLNIRYDVRGTIDLAVGAALIQGALFYFRAKSLNPKESSL